MDDLIHTVPGSAGVSGEVRHPLEPLSAAEIRMVMAVIRGAARSRILRPAKRARGRPGRMCFSTMRRGFGD